MTKKNKLQHLSNQKHLHAKSKLYFKIRFNSYELIHPEKIKTLLINETNRALEKLCIHTEEVKESMFKK